MLSLNARIEAARAGGTAGAAFEVVASAMTQLSENTAKVADNMQERVAGALAELGNISSHLAVDVRGTRLADLAMMNMDLIDRNLYERSCDCRWWATDPAFVDALTKPSKDALSYASSRMSVILNAYTVYFDLVLCDASGRVVANGRPEKYSSVRQDCSRAEWFTKAMATATGDDFAFESVHPSPLVGGERVLVYSAAVREGGKATGKPLGALGLVFNWDGLAKRVVTGTPIEENEREHTRVVIADPSGLVLSDTAGRELADKIDFPRMDAVMQTAKGFTQAPIKGDQHLIAHGKSQGFETYATGWFAFILQKIKAH